MRVLDSAGIPLPAVLDAIDGGIVVIDPAERVVRWNRWMASATGKAEADVLGRTLPEIFEGTPLKRLPHAIRSALQSSASTLITHALNASLLPLSTRSGRPLFHDITVTPIGNDPPSACVLFVTDVMMATKREMYLRNRQNARYDAVVARAADVIMTVDDAGIIQMANPATVSQFGFSESALIGRQADALFETSEAWQATWQDALRGMPSSQPTALTARRKDGSAAYLEASASRWPSGTRMFVTVILRDISQRRATDAALRTSESEARQAAAALTELNQTLEERVQQRTAQLMKTEEVLRQSQKMEAIGNLTGGIAHDFNNLLHVIGGNLHLLKRHVAGVPAAQQRLQTALAAVARSAKLSSQLLAFARRQPLDPKVIHVEGFTRDAEDMLRKAVGEGVVVDVNFAADLWNTLVDPGNLENALLNLAINARDAMEGRGRLVIDARNATLDAEYAEAHPEVTPGQYVLISVADNGSGMSPEVAQQAFDPFFTTKPEGRGTGLGLSMVYGFVNQSGGHIQIDSELGRGTTIRIYLPRSLQAAEQAADMDVASTAGGGEMVLVAEDDESVRETVVALLNDLGYRVLKAKDAQSALTIIESGMPIDLLFTDVVMPGALQSTELARKARERMPHLAVLFTSGYSEGALAPEGRLEAGVELLSKPYSRDALALKVRHVLSQAALRRAMATPSANES
jgi:PAS domain S-box-containing protein